MTEALGTLYDYIIPPEEENRPFVWTNVLLFYTILTGCLSAFLLLFVALAIACQHFNLISFFQTTRKKMCAILTKHGIMMVVMGTLKQFGVFEEGGKHLYAIIWIAYAVYHTPDAVLVVVPLAPPTTTNNNNNILINEPLSGDEEDIIKEEKKDL